MTKAKNCLLVAILSVIGYFYYQVSFFFSPPSVPYIDENVWWASEKTGTSDVSVRKFEINVSEEVIEDLKWRLENHRPLVPPIEDAVNRYGLNTVFLKQFIEFWNNEYNWTERQNHLNKYPQFKTNIQGLDIHFIHIKPEPSTSKKIVPLILLHGWPGSVVEFYDVIKILTTINEHTQNRKFSLEVVVPNMPGFGFSQATTKPGLSTTRIAVLMKKLMNRLGHDKFYAQGGDYGSLTLQILSVLYPDSVLGFHTNFPMVYTPKSYLKPILGLLIPFLGVEPEHYDRVYPLMDMFKFFVQESGYFHLQLTKPDTIGTALNESPVSLAVYFIEKFITGVNFSWVNTFDMQDLDNTISFTRLVDNLMYYWITGSITTSVRLYYETFGKLWETECVTLLRIPVQVPTIIFRSKYDLFMPDRSVGELYPKLLNLTDYDTGHFPALQKPNEFSQNLLNAIEKFETSK